MEKGVPIRSLSRGIAVLQAVNRGGALSMMEIARTSDLPYPTACRIVQTLLHEGLVEREPSRKRYRPTGLVQTLAHGYHGHGRLVQKSRPHIIELTKRYGWPITLCTHVGHSMILRDSTHSLSALTFNAYYPGYEMPILECAAGIAYLAYMPDDERRAMLEALKLLPEKISFHGLALMEEGKQIEEIRRCGYVTRDFNRFTRNPGKTSSIAVPLFENGHVVGTLTLAFFSSALRMPEAVERFAGPMMEVARAIKADLEEGQVAYAA
jgi:IclR family transcriptional regulator, mhp operon transcriptional activator